MSVSRPYRRTCRQFVDGKYTDGGRWAYMVHPKYAQSPEHYVRAFLIILKDLQELFDYVEPADSNLGCYSFRIHGLLLRACVEVEANCKAILKENGYSRPGDWNMGDYKKIEQTHLLSAYKVRVPHWNGTMFERTPFAAWKIGGTLPWYDAYNKSKHDRRSEFARATFEHLIDACCGLLVVLSAQFETNDFSPGPNLAVLCDVIKDGFTSGIGGFFRVQFPATWPTSLQYDFDWSAIEAQADPFDQIDYSKIP
jgi:hypothetical protein